MKLLTIFIMVDILFSIIMPSYNSEAYIKRAIDSIIFQTYEKWELIIIDNYSTDLTLEIIQEYNNNKIKVFQIENNGVIAKSRNFGIKKSKGDFVAFLDSDDFWTIDKLEKSSKFMQNGFDFLYHKLKISNESKKIIFSNYVYSTSPGDNIFEKLISNGNFIPNSSVVVRRTLLEEVDYLSEDENLIAAEDYDCWLRISKISKKFFYLNEKLGYYRYSGLGSNNAINRLKNIGFLKNKYFFDFKPIDLPSWLFYLEIRSFYLTGNHEDFNKYFSLFFKMRLTFMNRCKILFMKFFV